MPSSLPTRVGDRPLTTPTNPPRDEAELEVVEGLVRASHTFTRAA